MSELIEGLVIKAQSGFFTVHAGEEEVVCRVRGKLRKKRLDSTLVALGDRVSFSRSGDGSGMIEDVTPRTRVLARLAPSAKGRGGRRGDREGFLAEREQVIIANPDQVVFVFSCANPSPRLRMLDRLLVGAEVQRIPIVVCANKTDLVGEDAARELFGAYERIGYRVLYTSASLRHGTEELRDMLVGRISALVGPSGVGKTSLLNEVQPGLGLRVREVSLATTKGKHTTVASQLVPMASDGWVADTPGIRALALFDLDPEELDAYFPDIAPYVADCQFSDCAHKVEPGCAVRAALERGDIGEHRYESYTRLREEHQRLADMYWWGIE